MTTSPNASRHDPAPPRLVGAVLRCMTLLALAACGGHEDASTGPVTMSAPYSRQACAGAWGSSTVSSQWVHPDSTGLLAYQPLNANGDRIMDFSAAGYMGGGVSLPSPAPTMSVSPIGNGADDTSSIQRAIDAVSAMPLSGGGSRGVVLLTAGSFFVQGGLNISASGVVLRGSGSGAGGTVINDTNPAQNGGATASSPLVTVSGTGAFTKVSSSSVSITGSYVPSGATTLTLSSAAGFQVGSHIVIERPVTSVWVSFMQLANLPAGDTWLKIGSNTSWQRTVTAISGNQITLDVPLSDSMDATYVNPPGGMVSLSTLNGPLQQVGVEHLRLVGVPRTPNTNNSMLTVDDSMDSWVNDVVGDNFTSGLTIGAGASRVTATGIVLTHENNDPAVPCTGAKFAEFSVSGSQVLLNRSSSSGSAASFYYVTGSAAGGPNVVLNFQGTPDTVCSNSSIQLHQRWATGLLVDGASLAANAKDSASIDFINRGTAGSGQGWAIGWGVVWNSIGTMDIQAPPGTTNWAIGSTGTVVAQTTEAAGTFDSPNVPVAPQSLYLAQMCQRLGPQALKNIGY